MAEDQRRPAHQPRAGLEAAPGRGGDPRAAGRAQDAEAARRVRVGAAGQGAPRQRPAAPRLPGGGARTGRFSSRQPNMQQMPKRQLRRSSAQLPAPPGRVLAVADYSQIELRVAAELSGDAAMLAAYRSGQDLHTRTARGVSGKPRPSEAERTLAKALNFGLLYGAGARTFRDFAQAGYGVALTLERGGGGARAVLRHLSRLRGWQSDGGGRAVRRLRADRRRPALALGMGGGGLARRGGRAGRRTMLAEADPAAWSSPARDHRDPPGFRYTFALNHPVQGSAAEVTQLALAELDRALRPLRRPDHRHGARRDRGRVRRGSRHRPRGHAADAGEDDDGVPGVVPRITRGGRSSRSR